MTKTVTNPTPKVGDTLPAAFVIQWKIDRLAAQWDARRVRNFASK